jgi:hypothetical protein
VGDTEVVNDVLSGLGAGRVRSEDVDAVLASHREGTTRGVKGSPQFFVGTDGYFCPSLDIVHEDGGYDISFDVEGFRSFLDAALQR